MNKIEIKTFMEGVLVLILGHAWCILLLLLPKKGLKRYSYKWNMKHIIDALLGGCSGIAYFLYLSAEIFGRKSKQFFISR